MSSRSDIGEVYTSLGAHSALIEYSDNTYSFDAFDSIGSPGYDFLISASGSSSDGRVHALYLWFPAIYDETAFRADFARFAPAQIITTYGPPDRVWLQAFRDAPYHWYQMYLFYDRLGFALRYSLTAERTEEATFRFCPAASDSRAFDEIALAVRAQTGIASLESLLELEPLDVLPPIITLREAANLEPSDLAQGINNSGQDYCFTAPEAAFPPIP